MYDDRGRRGEVRNAMGAYLLVAAVVGEAMRAEAGAGVCSWSWWWQVDSSRAEEEGSMIL